MSFEKVLVMIFAFFLIGGLNSGLAVKHSAKYAITTLPTPVLHTPDFPGVFGRKDGSTLRLDEENQIGELEFIAFPKTVFQIEEIIEDLKNCLQSKLFFYLPKVVITCGVGTIKMACYYYP